MQVYKLSDMVKGWFVGNFSPTLLSTNDVEVGVKKYQQGEEDVMHHHKIATEITVVLNGEVEMRGKRYFDGDIIVIKPGESTNFKAITEVTTVVVKLPGASNDKYIDE
ncbi:MAG: hypothetical protein QM737_01650 [Ferruginibacter sp.]